MLLLNYLRAKTMFTTVTLLTVRVNFTKCWTLSQRTNYVNYQCWHSKTSSGVLQQSSYIYTPQRRSLNQSPRSFSLYGDKLQQEDFDAINANGRDAKERAQEAFALLAQQGRSWQRLSHMVDMAIDDHETHFEAGNRQNEFDASTVKRRTVADIGTDHGLLAMGLALSGRFEKVIGVDVSDKALQNGAFTLLEQVQIFRASKLKKSTHDDTQNTAQKAYVDVDSHSLVDIPVEFRLGDGLKVLKHGEADTICIAGMGVNNMIEILDQKSCSDDSGFGLTSVGCSSLILQPTNTRPRNLILLYDKLQQWGWDIRDERIEKINSRWYITVRFEKSTKKESDPQPKSVLTEFQLPGSNLFSLAKSDPMKQTFLDYCHHHCQWIQQDAQARKGILDVEHIRWTTQFCDNI